MTTQVTCRSVTSDNLIDFLPWAIDAARADTSLLDCATVVQLRNLRVRLLTRNAHYAEMAKRRLYGGGENVGPCEEITVAVLSPDDSSMPSPPAWGEAVFHPRQFEQGLEGTAYRATYFHDCRLWQIYDRHQNFCLQWMTGPSSYPDWELGAPLRVFLHWAYRSQGMRLAHAGTLGNNRDGLMLVGKGGSGKSGTVVGGIVHGLETVGDDYVLIEQGDHAVTAYPLYPTFKQDRGGLARLGLEAKISATRSSNWQDKFEFRCDEISRQSLASRMRIRAIVLPRIAPATESMIRAIPKSRAMLALAPTGLFQMPGERDSGVTFYSELIRRVPCFELTLSRDPVNVSKTLGEFIDRGFQCA